MAELSWREAIIQVLRLKAEPMHYVDIATEVADQKLKEVVGATPPYTVNATITASMKAEGAGSPFRRVSRGVYGLGEWVAKGDANLSPADADDAEELAEAGLINAFGMYWSRASVLWKSSPRLLGCQQVGSTAVDFCGQRGVYLLYDGRTVVYVGRAIDQPVGVRLGQHLTDRLNGRWDRFSWFGLYRATDTGQLDTAATPLLTPSLLIATMEALLIEGLEPPQNRKRGDDFRAVEFLQMTDPDIQKQEIYKLMDELKKKL